jgi:hypothetical protein
MLFLRLEWNNGIPGNTPFFAIKPQLADYVVSLPAWYLNLCFFPEVNPPAGNLPMMVLNARLNRKPRFSAGIKPQPSFSMSAHSAPHFRRRRC